MPVTLKDIAKHTGLSVSSVSNILSGNDPRYNEKTRERVLKAASALDYHPHRAARIMQGRDSQVLGVLVPDLSYSYFPEIIKGIETVADEGGYQVLLGQTHYNPQELLRKLALLREHSVDGLILFPIPFSRDPDVTKRMKDLPFPVVCVDSRMAGMRYDYVGTDDYTGSFEATHFLTSQGHTRIVCVGFGDESPIQTARYKGYADALATADIPVDQELVVPGPWEIDAPAGTLLKLFRAGNRPTAIFAMSDLMAVWACLRLKEAGMHIPGNVSVIGFGGLHEGKWFDPPLSTMTQKMEEMGRQAVSLILKRIINPKEAVREILLEPKLTIRSSCAPARRNV